MSVSVELKENTILRGRYLVGKMLGQGGFGITYEGMDLVLETKIAIKEYYPMGIAVRNSTISNDILWSQTQISTQQWQEGCDGFLKEARRMAKIDSLPGIVRVRDTFPENQTAYIVMDFVEGQNLKDYLRDNGTMTVSRCLELFVPLMESLAKIHKKEIIHRDISPDNIMLQPDGTLCLLDFGAAKDISLQKNAASKQVAKKGFSPPEQYMDSGIIGPWTDVYALCATMYYCITGKMVPEAMERVWNDTLTFDVPMQEMLPTSVMEQFKRGLALRSEERIASMGELLLGLTKKQGTVSVEPEKTVLPEESVKVEVVQEVHTTVVEVQQEVPVNIGKTETFKEQNIKKPKLKMALFFTIPVVAALIVFMALLPGWKWDYSTSSAGVVIHDYKGNEEEIEIPNRIWGKDVITVEPYSNGFGINVDQLKAISVAKNHQYLSSEEGVLYNKDMSELLVYPKDKTRMFTFVINAEKIGDCAFQNSRIDDVEITVNVKTIGALAFYDCEYLKEVFIPYSVTEIGNGAFSSSGLNKIKFSDGLKELSHAAFRDTNIVEVDLPVNLEVIGTDVFYGCEKLEYVWIPKTVKQIDSGAFSDCSSLEYIQISPDCQVDEKIFGYSKENEYEIEILYFEPGLLSSDNGTNTKYVFDSDYLREDIKNIYFVEIMNVFDGIEDIWDVSWDMSGSVWAGVKKCEDDSDMYDLYIESYTGVRAVDCEGLFAYYSNVETIDFGGLFYTDKAVSMENMFYDCYDLKRIDVTGFDTSNVENMEHMFALCNRLKEINVSSFDTSNVTNMSFMFTHCESLERLDLNNFDVSSVETMVYMFKACKSLNEIKADCWQISPSTKTDYMFEDTPLGEKSSSSTSIAALMEKFGIK